MHCKRLLAFIVVLCLSMSLLITGVPSAQAQTFAPTRPMLNNGLALTPPLGWSSWNHFEASINESVIKSQADALVSSGMQTAGYQYINIDEGWWSGSRATNGNIIVDTTKWPDGMQGVAAYIHSKGLKAGIYTDAGINGCGGSQQGSYGHYAQDMLQFARWGFDYVKVDWCGGNETGLDPTTQYSQIRDAVAQAIAQTGHQMTFSLCNWGVQSPWVWGPGTGNLWRTTADITCYSASCSQWDNMLGNLDSNAQHAASAGPGAWNDPDMLEVGNGGMTPTEDQSHFSMWAIMAAPLIAGNDLTNMTSTTNAILTNTEVIAVDQDSAGIQGQKVADNGSGLQVWSKKLQGNGLRAVVLFNRSNSAANITANWSDLGLSGSVSVRDLLTHTDLGSFSNNYTASVPAHGVVMLKLTGSEGSATSYEAEASANTLAGGTFTAACTVCSGGQDVHNVGYNGTLQFNNVNVSSVGSYTLTFFYINGDHTRTGYMSVNGGPSIPVNFPGTNDGNWNNVQSLALVVSLNAGNNTLKFSNSAYWTPDFDRLTISSNPTFATAGYYKFVNRNSGKVLDLYDFAMTNGGVIDQWSDNGGPNQRWTLISTGGGTFQIVSTDSGKVIDVYDLSTADGGVVDQWDSNNGTNQQWGIVDAGGGYYKIVNVNSGKVLEVSNSSTTDGGAVDQRSDNGGPNQQWSIVQV